MSYVFAVFYQSFVHIALFACLFEFLVVVVVNFYMIMAETTCCINSIPVSVNDCLGEKCQTGR